MKRQAHTATRDTCSRALHIVTHSVNCTHRLHAVMPPQTRRLVLAEVCGRYPNWCGVCGLYLNWCGVCGLHRNWCGVCGLRSWLGWCTRKRVLHHTHHVPCPAPRNTCSVPCATHASTGAAGLALLEAVTVCLPCRHPFVVRRKRAYRHMSVAGRTAFSEGHMEAGPAQHGEH